MTGAASSTIAVKDLGRRGGFGSLGSLIYLLVIAWAAAIATYPLNDNSFFTHLATGRLILDAASVPSVDPYTFTAQGEPWIVQSWLASVAYASFERLGGDVGLRLLVLLVFIAAATLFWKLTSSATSIITRLLITALGLFVVSDLWSERPYMIGVIGLSIVWLALDGRIRPWLLVPLLWVWTNTHGSYPIAVALCVAVVVGGMLDRRCAGESVRVPRQEARAAGSLLLGIVMGAIGPLGVRVWLFPFTAMTKSSTLGEVVEWRAPTFQSVAERAFLVLVLATIVLLAISRSPRWRLVLPTVGFTAMGLLAQRNMVVAAVVLVAVCAASAPAAGVLKDSDRPRLGPALAGLVAALTATIVGLCLITPVDGFGGYPTRALAYVEGSEIEGRVATEMPAGNLLEVLDGAEGAVFIDDRVDMFPQAVFDDFLTLRRGTSGWEDVLDRRRISAVIWDRTEPLASLLAVSPGWKVVYADTAWVVVQRRPA